MRGANINLPLPGGGSSIGDTSLLALSRGSRKLVLCVVVALFLLYTLTRNGAPTSLPTPLVEGVRDAQEHVHDQVQAEVVPKKAVEEYRDEAEERPVSSSNSGALSRAILAKDGTTFSTYLTTHFPLSSATSPTPHLWLTLADGHWATTGTLALHTFVQRLNRERKAAGRGDRRETRLVVLCLDEACVRNCEERGMWAYGGYQFTRPDKVRLYSIVQVFSLC